mmetsp:Transcript_33082/g.99965  ORF Transcript_33082/g.99965 Transcript_33082/m.99965 type:complete len:317 (-) Transcript_33082:837-1787(-)
MAARCARKPTALLRRATTEITKMLARMTVAKAVNIRVTTATPGNSMSVTICHGATPDLKGPQLGLWGSGRDTNVYTKPAYTMHENPRICNNVTLSAEVSETNGRDVNRTNANFDHLKLSNKSRGVMTAMGGTNNWVTHNKHWKYISCTALSAISNSGFWNFSVDLKAHFNSLCVNQADTKSDTGLISMPTRSSVATKLVNSAAAWSSAHAYLNESCSTSTLSFPYNGLPANNSTFKPMMTTRFRTLPKYKRHRFCRARVAGAHDSIDVRVFVALGKAAPTALITKLGAKPATCSPTGPLTTEDKVLLMSRRFTVLR